MTEPRFMDEFEHLHQKLNLRCYATRSKSKTNDQNKYWISFSVHSISEEKNQELKWPQINTVMLIKNLHFAFLQHTTRIFPNGISFLNKLLS